MFETRSEAWEAVGLAADVTEGSVRRAKRETAVLVPVVIGTLVVYGERFRLFGFHSAGTNGKPPAYDPLWFHIGTAVVLVVLGWTIARDVGRAAGPTIFRRMDPSMAGTVGFLIRLAGMAITLLVALRIAGVSAGTLLAGSTFTAVILGLAAQQTLGNLFAGLVLLSARPFKVGERVRFQAGAVAGSAEGVVASLGLMYTTLARGADRIMIPNNVVLSAAVVPLREPPKVDVRVRLQSGIRPSQVQELLNENVTTPTRSPAEVLLEELDGDDVVIRVQATPEEAADGAQLADEIIAVLANVTGEHTLVNVEPSGGRTT
jgi:small-conductance mechanosensitive channel